jgi:serine/threonine protein kinase
MKSQNTDISRNEDHFDPKIIGEYEILETIGEGGYGIVYKARHQPTNLIVAVKTISKETISSEKQKEIIFSEMNIQKALHHPFVTEIFDFFQSLHKYYIIMEYAPNGNLHSLIKKNEYLQERKAKQIFLQLISALEYLHHEKHISHRDLKAENIIFDKFDNLRIIDFGLSKEFTVNNQMFQTKCGTISYIPPEVIQKNFYNHTCDIWSAGILLYYMVSGQFPFVGNETTIFQKILSAEPLYPASFSPELINLLSSMLCKNPANRIPLKNIKDHTWFSDFEYNHLLFSKLNYHCYNFSIVDQNVVLKVQSLGIDISHLIQNLSTNKFEIDTKAYRMFFKEKITKCFQCLNQSEEYHQISIYQPQNLIANESCQNINESSRISVQTHFNSGRYSGKKLVRPSLRKLKMLTSKKSSNHNLFAPILNAAYTSVRNDSNENL